MKYVRNTYTGINACIEATLAATAYAKNIGATLITSATDVEGITDEDIIDVDGYDLYIDELLSNGAILTLPKS